MDAKNEYIDDFKKIEDIKDEYLTLIKNNLGKLLAVKAPVNELLEDKSTIKKKDISETI